jgi:CheY-like chemotaxis protein
MATVLVIDDEPSLRQTVRRALQSEKHEVLEAGDGVTALRLMADHRLDLVVTDLYMPRMDGMEFTIRLSQQNPHPRIIAISGGGFMEKGSLLETARRLGADATLAKPFTIKELLETVSDVLKRGEPK